MAEELSGLKEAVSDIQAQMEKISDAITNHEVIIKEGNLATWKDLQDTCAATQQEIAKVEAMQEANSMSHQEMRSEFEKLKAELADIRAGIIDGTISVSQ